MYSMKYQTNYRTTYIIYTDASKTDNGVGVVAVIQQTELSERLSDYCSIYSAEALAIYKALSYIISTNLQNKKYVIFTDSMST
jgi:ribonuclease HI